VLAKNEENLMTYLNEDDVVCTGTSQSSNFGLGTTFKPEELFKAAVGWIVKVDSSSVNYSNWFKSDGIKCQVLKTEGGGWQSGQVRFRVEFVPDEPPAKSTDPNSPLDDFRSNLNM
jgi:hypothetical protein